VIAVARGNTTDRVVQFSHDGLDTFGKGSDYAKPYLQALIRQAVASGIISMDISRYGALTLEAGALDIQRLTFSRIKPALNAKNLRKDVQRNLRVKPVKRCKKRP